MSDEVVRPQDILNGGLREQLEKAVIDAFMAKGAVESGAVGGLFFKAITEEDGKTRYKYEFDQFGNNPTIYCDYPDGEWKQHKAFRGDKDLDLGTGGATLIDSGDNAYQVTLFDTHSAWDAIRAEVAAWIDPWVNDCPSPNVYANQINSMAKIAAQLYVGNAPSAGAGGATTSADLDLWDALTELDISADTSSIAFDAFQRTYSTDIWKTIGGQQAMAFAAGLVLTAEGAAWSETCRSLRDLIQVAIHDFSSFAGSHESSGEGVAAFLGATSAVAGLLGSTVGKAWPPFGAAMSVLGGGIGVYGLMSPPIPEVADASLVLSGGSYAEKLASFKTQVKKVNSDLRVAERAIAQGCRALVHDSRAFPDNYSLTRGARRGGQGAGDDFEGLLREELKLDTQKLRRVAGACQAIGDHQIGLARILAGSDAVGNPSACVADEWYRGTLPEVGVIGSDYRGPFEDYQRLVNELEGLLIGEGKNSHRVADHVIAMALDFDATDAERGRVLASVAETFDRHELIRGNDPDDPTVP